MKQFLPVLLSILFGTSLFAQQLPTQPPSIKLTEDQGKPILQKTLKSGNSATCGVDTVLYVESKMTGALGSTMNIPSEFYGYAQYFDAPQPITVEGFRFHAGINSTNGDTAAIICRVYTAATDSTPTTILTEKTITIGETYFPTNLPAMQYDVIFDSIPTVTGPYFVSIETFSSLPIGVMQDDYNAGDGQGENLMYWRWTGDSVWYMSQDFFAWDVDALFYPFVSYNYGAYGSVANDTLCIGAAAMLCFDSASAIYYNRMYNQNTTNNILWDLGDGNNSTDSCVSHTYASNGAYTVTLMNTLTGWTMNCPGTDTMTVIVDAPIVGLSTQGGNIACLGNPIQFVNTSSYSTTLNYLWDFGDSNTSTDMNPSYTYATAGTYTVTLTATGTDGCSAIDSVVNMITIVPLPVPSFTHNITIAPSVDFTNTTPGTNVYTWDFGGQGTSSQTNPSFTFPGDGTYMVCLTAVDSNGCADSTCAPVVIIGTGIADNELNSQITVFPNPSNGVFTISQTTGGNLMLDVMDIAGKVINRKRLMNLNEQIDLTSLAEGTYLLQFTSSTTTTVKRINITR